MPCIPEFNCVLEGQEVQQGWLRSSQVNGRGGATMEHVVSKALFLVAHRDFDMTCPTFRTFWCPLRDIETSKTNTWTSGRNPAQCRRRRRAIE